MSKIEASLERSWAIADLEVLEKSKAQFVETVMNAAHILAAQAGVNLDEEEVRGIIDQQAGEITYEEEVRIENILDETSWAVPSDRQQHSTLNHAQLGL